MKKVCLYICLVICFTACKRERLMDYEGGDNICMTIQAWIGAFQSDTNRIVFSQNMARKDTNLSVRFFTIGQIAHSNRSFKLVVSDSSTAVANRDYVLPPEDHFFIPADSLQTIIPLTIKQVHTLPDKSVTLILKLQPNEHFGTNVPIYDPGFGGPRSVVRLKVTIAQ